jgi:hypothetical protein
LRLIRVTKPITIGIIANLKSKIFIFQASLFNSNIKRVALSIKSTLLFLVHSLALF